MINDEKKFMADSLLGDLERFRAEAKFKVMLKTLTMNLRIYGKLKQPFRLGNLFESRIKTIFGYSK